MFAFTFQNKTFLFFSKIEFVINSLFIQHNQCIINGFVLSLFLMFKFFPDAYSQSDTLHDKNLYYILPYEVEYTGGMKKNYRSITTFFRCSPDENLQIISVQKGNYIFSLDSIQLKSNDWYIIKIEEYFDKKKQPLNANLSIFHQSVLIKQESSPVIDTINFKGLIINYRIKNDSRETKLIFDTLPHYRFHTP
ncbi:MAG: hypothetical protein KatS3mg034_0549 [Vicingaceae bacterium]|nr:MAG: hypothetical protein KatS3mg034_0549 [Vicingaceae bacterium]